MSAACSECDRALPASEAAGGSRRCRPCARAWRVQASCEVCGISLARRRASRFCSARCADVCYGRCLAEPLASRACALSECDVQFRPLRDSQRCCSEAHGKRYWRISNPEKIKAGRAPWNDTRRAAYGIRRALRKGASTGEPVRFTEIAARDGWKCHLCRQRVGQSLHWPHPRSASLDHLIPLSLGGAHDPSNIRLAHLTCNMSKHNRAVNEQLLLVG